MVVVNEVEQKSKSEKQTFTLIRTVPDGVATLHSCVVSPHACGGAIIFVQQARNNANNNIEMREVQ